MAFPNLPGIPPLKITGPLIAGAALLAAAGIQKLLDLAAPTWAIYSLKTGQLAIKPDSFLGVEYTNASNISSYPIEEGSFAAYNKVQTPKSWVVHISKGGSQKDLMNFETTLEALQNSIDLFFVVTPTRTYEHANIDKVDYQRLEKNGAGMIIATLHFVEIREAQTITSAPGATSPTATVPSAQAAQDTGQVSAAPAPVVSGSIQ